MTGALWIGLAGHSAVLATELGISLSTAPTYRFWVVALPLTCCVTSVRKENKPALHLARSRQRINSSCYSSLMD